MSKRKRVAVTTAIICALFGIIYLAVSFLPYNKNSKWSSLYFEADLGKIYGQIIYVFLTIFLYLLKCPQSLIL